MDGYNPNHGGASYRPVDQTAGVPDGDLGTEGNGDIPRIDYVNSGQIDYDTGWTTPTSPPPLGKLHPALSRRKMEHLSASGGERRSSPTSPSAWLDVGGLYRHRSAGPIRCSATWRLADLYLGAYDDVAGNLIEWDTDGSPKTLTIVCAGGNYNANFFMLVPVDPTYKPLPFVGPITPDGNAQMFAYTNMLSFTANSVPGITSDNVVVTLNGFKPSASPSPVHLTP